MNARSQIHLGHCGEAAHCTYTGGPGGDCCTALDAALDQAGDERAHAEAKKLLDLHMDTLLTHGPQVAQGLALAITVIDPYVMRDGALVRKSDGSPVPTLPAGETS